LSFCFSYFRQEGVKFSLRLLAGLRRKLLNRFSPNSVERWDHGPWKKELDFGGQGRSQYEARRGNCLVFFSSATNFAHLFHDKANVKFN